MEDRLKRTEAETGASFMDMMKTNCAALERAKSRIPYLHKQLHCCFPTMIDIILKSFSRGHTGDLVNRVREDQFSHLQRKLSKQSTKCWVSRFVFINDGINIDSISQVPLERVEQILA